MKTAIYLPLSAKNALRKLGEDIKNARKRRRIPVELMAERASVSRTTISKVEKGDSTTSMGAYCSVLFVLGMTNQLRNLADVRNDETGLFLEEERLPERIRFSKKKAKNE
jgi:transcriptional regulator with XRE-family HTH domain